MAGSKKKVEAETKAKAVAGKDEVETKQSKRVMQPGTCRSYMRKRLADEFPEIVSGFVEEAKKGSCTHLKLATDLLKPTRKGSSRKKSSVRQLAEEWALLKKKRAEEKQGEGE